VAQLALSAGDSLAVFCIVDPCGDRRSTICPNVRENNDNGSARLGKTIRPSSVGRKARDVASGMCTAALFISAAEPIKRRFHRPQ
jgi:hypothetical protein